MGEGAILKLVLEKGPREGETLEFRPGSVIRLGRVVRGNSVTIKDSGISSKHLCIQFKDDSGKWLITDLDSSNGTILNGTKIPANNPLPLADGDTIKVGEYTSIIVSVSGGAQAKRQSRRPTAGIVKGEEVVGESSELGLGFRGDLGNNEVEKPKQRGRRRKEKVLENDSVISSFEAENAKEMGNEGVAKMKSIELTSKSVVPENEAEKRSKEVENVTSVEVNEGRHLRLSTRRNAKKEESVKLSPVLDGIPEDYGKHLESMLAIERKTRKGRGKRKNIENEVSKNSEKVVLEEKEIVENLVADLHQVVLEQDVGDSMKNGFSETLQVEDVLKTKVTEQKETTSGAKDGKVDLREEPNLENMTLGEWFDFLEVYLPKQIHDQTEEMITNMRKRAEQNHEYMVQQKLAMKKGKSPVA